MSKALNRHSKESDSIRSMKRKTYVFHRKPSELESSNVVPPSASHSREAGETTDRVPLDRENVRSATCSARELSAPSSS
eukprot:3568024-Pleurochrysis_carterae.AAC.1